MLDASRLIRSPVYAVEGMKNHRQQYSSCIKLDTRRPARAVTMSLANGTKCDMSGNSTHDKNVLETY